VKKANILIVDDDIAGREAMTVVLEDEYQCIQADSGFKALEVIKTEPIDLALVDVNMPVMDGIECLRQIKEWDRDIEVIMVSAINSAQKAVSALRLGAYDYITKPFEDADLLATVRRALEGRTLKRELAYLREELITQGGFGKIITQNHSMKELLEMVEKVSQAPSCVLITGESGTGKELIARAIHSMSPRKDRPFVAVNCGAIPSELMESEFFGHERGAFTGAGVRKIGKFEYANGGTLFLDEVSTFPMNLQVKLLRVLQEREFQRVGSNANIKVDVRVIAATNADLEEGIRRGTFREDLYFRLKVIPLRVPPLRERKEDIPLLIAHFLERYSQRYRKRIKALTPDAIKVLIEYPWPGNVRELENMVERLIVLEDNDAVISVNDLPPEVFSPELVIRSIPEGASLREACLSYERRLVIDALKKARWNKTEAARILKLHRNTIIQKMKTFKIQEGEL